MVLKHINERENPQEIAGREAKRINKSKVAHLLPRSTLPHLDQKEEGED